MSMVQRLVKSVYGARGSLFRDVGKQHQLRIAKDTLQMSDEGALIMGGMTKDEARVVLREAGWSDARIAKFEGREGEYVNESYPRHASKRVKIGYKGKKEIDGDVHIKYEYGGRPGVGAMYDEPGYGPELELVIKSAEMDYLGDLMKYPDLIADLEAALAEIESVNADEYYASAGEYNGPDRTEDVY